MVAFSLVKALPIVLALSHVQAIAIPSASTEVAKDNIVRRGPDAEAIASSDLWDRSDQSPNPAEESKRRLQKRNNNCGNSTFINRTTANSPFIDDCTRLLDLERRFANTYVVPAKTTNWLRITSFGTCAFRVINTAAYPALLGNEDIADLIRDSIAEFRAGDKVGGEGRMPCGSSGPFPQIWVRWYINRT